MIPCPPTPRDGHDAHPARLRDDTDRYVAAAGVDEDVLRELGDGRGQGRRLHIGEALVAREATRRYARHGDVGIVRDRDPDGSLATFRHAAWSPPSVK